MTPIKAALHIQRYATEAIEGLRTQGATADTENRLIDIKALAHDIAKDLESQNAKNQITKNCFLADDIDQNPLPSSAYVKEPK